jgi:hypothetical protein
MKIYLKEFIDGCIVSNREDLKNLTGEQMF